MLSDIEIAQQNRMEKIQVIADKCLSLIHICIGVGLSGASANLQAILTEKVSKKHLMGAYHGGWSFGGFAGAGVLLVLLKILSLPVNQSIWGLLIVLFIAMVVVSQFMLTFGSDPNAKVTKKSKSPLSFHPIALIFGLLSFVSYLVEGAVGDWSALYLFEYKGIVIEEAVMGVMLFNGTMCIEMCIRDSMHIVYKGDRVMNALQDLIKTYASQYKEQVVEWRRHIHSHPELSGEEKNTSLFIQKVLGEMCIRDRYKAMSFVGENRDVKDPWYTGNFDETYDDISRSCDALLALLKEKL